MLCTLYCNHDVSSSVSWTRMNKSVHQIDLTNLTFDFGIIKFLFPHGPWRICLWILNLEQWQHETWSIRSAIVKSTYPGKSWVVIEFGNEYRIVARSITVSHDPTNVDFAFPMNLEGWNKARGSGHAPNTSNSRRPFQPRRHHPSFYHLLDARNLTGRSEIGFRAKSTNLRNYKVCFEPWYHVTCY